VRAACVFVFSIPVEEAAGFVTSTHDEAVAVARLARQRGWERVILVTDATHMRRAAANFEKAGLHVLCSPCAPRDYQLPAPATPGQRRRAFRDWLYETYQYQTNRLQGWV
jgi:uncharacterized SAM-binding protein YcdF (DUF218 family)